MSLLQTQQEGPESGLKGVKRNSMVFFILVLIETELELDLRWLSLFICVECFPQSEDSHVLVTSGVFRLSGSEPYPEVTPWRVTQLSCPQ